MCECINSICNTQLIQIGRLCPNSKTLLAIETRYVRHAMPKQNIRDGVRGEWMSGVEEWVCEADWKKKKEIPSNLNATPFIASMFRIRYMSYTHLTHYSFRPKRRRSTSWILSPCLSPLFFAGSSLSIHLGQGTDSAVLDAELSERRRKINRFQLKGYPRKDRNKDRWWSFPFHLLQVEMQH